MYFIMTVSELAADLAALKMGLTKSQYQFVKSTAALRNGTPKDKLILGGSWASRQDFDIPIKMAERRGMSVSFSPM